MAATCLLVLGVQIACDVFELNMAHNAPGYAVCREVRGGQHCWSRQSPLDDEILCAVARNDADGQTSAVNALATGPGPFPLC